jgi:HAD superfamily hydrolase (TIGR01509 family)
VDHIKADYDLSFFDVVLFSSEIGVQKPAEEAFQMTVTAFQELPEHCLFIDDNLDNIQAAQKLGLKTIHCTNVELLEAEIDKILANYNHGSK